MDGVQGRVGIKRLSVPQIGFGFSYFFNAFVVSGLHFLFLGHFLRSTQT